MFRTCMLSFIFIGSIAFADTDFDSLKLGSGHVSVRVSFTAPGETWTGTLLSRRAPPGEPSLTVTAFMHQPFGKRFIGVAMDGIADGPNQASARTVRDDIVGGHLICAFTEMDASLDSGTHELIFRTDGKTAELFIDRIQCESRSAEKFTARTYLKLYPHSKPGWKTGSDPDGGDVFSGTIEKIDVQPRWLTDAEIGIQGTKPTKIENPKIIANGLYPSSMSDGQRMREMDADMPRWLAQAMKHDKWFPRYHVALPAGMMFDTRCAIHGGRYHLFPTWRSNMNLVRGTGGSFRMGHLGSADLIHWRINPFPIRLENTDVCNGSPANIDGNPQFFFLRYSRDGAPNRATPTDDSLTNWTLANPPPAITQDGEGYSGRLDSVVFQHAGKTYLTGTRRNASKPSMGMPLYRSDDLQSWKYIGDFFQTNTKPFNECPQIFTVGGKMVVAAFYPLHDRHNYLVGRFEDERFVMEGGGEWDHGGHAHNRSFDAEPAPDGRVIGWSTISVYADADAVDVARQGWKGMHSIPREVRLRPDNTLGLYPVREMERLRSKQTVTFDNSKEVRLPADHDGCFELELLLVDDESIIFSTPDGKCVLAYNAMKRTLVLDHKNAPKLGADYGHVFTMPALTDEQANILKVRLFFDRSVFEIYSAGHVMTSRYFSSDPSRMKAERTASQSKVTAWKLGAIWNLEGK